MGVENQSVVLLDTGFDFQEVVFIGTHDECREFILNELGPALEAEGDEEIYYDTIRQVSVADALKHRRDEL
jgi:hypothetical protein